MIYLKKVFAEVFMSRGRKVYFIITSIVAGIAAVIDLTAVALFLSIAFSGGSAFGQVLSLVILGISFFVYGGVVSAIAAIMSCFLLKFCKKIGIAYIIGVIGLFLIGVLCFYICGNVNKDTSSISLYLPFII